MSKAISQLRLLVSSTSELEAERSLLDRSIDDINRTLENLCAVTVRVIDWRRDVVPGVSTDPQAVINAQTADCDIYLGLLGTRFGTPTPRAGSGTEDEFNIAYSRFRRDPTSVRLLFYFRNALGGSVMDVDVDQLKRVQHFRTRLGNERGVLFCDFSSPEDFLHLFRNHLIQLVSDQWNGSAWKPVPGLDAIASTEVEVLVESGPEADAGDDEELGILDLRVQQDEAFASAMGAVRQIAELMTNSASADTQWMGDIQKAIAAGPNPKRAHELVNAKASDFGKRARDLRSLTATFDSASGEFFETLGRLIHLQLASGMSTTAEIQDGIRRISQADSVVRAARDTYLNVLASLSRLAEPTREFKRQKRSLGSQIEQLSASIGSWLDRSAALRARFGVGDDTSPGAGSAG